MQQKMDLLVARAAPFLRLTNCLCPRGMGVSPVLKGDEATIGAREERETREDSPTRPSSLRHFTYVAELPGPNTCLLPANNAVLVFLTEPLETFLRFTSLLATMPIIQQRRAHS